MGYHGPVRTAARWVLLGVLALLGGQLSAAGTGNHAHAMAQPGAEHPRALARYVAIGDSYTTGAGIPPGPLEGCFRSPRSYPHKLAKRLGVQLVDASCGGAQTANMKTPQPTSTGPNPPQEEALDRRTDLVTVSLGVNDAQFALILGRCVELARVDPQGSPCRDSFQSAAGDTLFAGLPIVEERVERVLRQVHRKAPNAQVVLVGYPQLAPETGTCPELPFAAGDYAYLSMFMLGMDKTMRDAAWLADVPYVSLLEASRGHDVCAGAKAWVNGLLSTPRTAVWHPFANEQRAVAALVADVVDQDIRLHSAG